MEMVKTSIMEAGLLEKEKLAGKHSLTQLGKNWLALLYDKCRCKSNFDSY